MIRIGYSKSFIRKYKKLDKELQQEVKSAIELLKEPKNHQNLKVHKLHGKLGSYYGFSVNYRIRIVFDYLEQNTVVLHSVDDHDIYK